MKQNKSKKPVSPIYTFAVIWLLLSLARPIYSLGRFFGVAVVALIGYFIAKAVAAGRQKKTEAEPEARTQPKSRTAQPDPQAQAKPAEPEKPKYSPEVQAIVDEGARAHGELMRLYFSIPDLKVKRKVQELMDVSDKIVADAIDDPSDVPQIKKFLDYYLPTTIKLLNAYDRMGAQGIQGENITKTMGSINEMLDTAIEAYKKLLDSLFANQAMDIETDIEVMNTLLKREGFSGGAGGSAFQVK